MIIKIRGKKYRTTERTENIIFVLQMIGGVLATIMFIGVTYALFVALYYMGC